MKIYWYCWIKHFGISKKVESHMFENSVKSETFTDVFMETCNVYPPAYKGL